MYLGTVCLLFCILVCKKLAHLRILYKAAASVAFLVATPMDMIPSALDGQIAFMQGTQTWKIKICGPMGYILYTYSNTVDTVYCRVDNFCRALNLVKRLSFGMGKFKFGHLNTLHHRCTRTMFKLVI